MPFDRKLAGMHRQPRHRAGQPRAFGNVGEQIIDRRSIDRGEHRLPVGRGKGKVAHSILQSPSPSGAVLATDGLGEAETPDSQPVP